jgi:methyl-coenzyme M reductase subunit D
MPKTPIPEAIPLPEIMIVPSRLLSAGTTENLLNKIRKVKHVRQLTVSGEDLPASISWGPGKGLEVDHDERRKIKYGGQEMELKVQVGRVFAEVDDIDSVQRALKEIETICEEILPFGFQMEVGRYSKYRPTVTDYKKRMR